MDFRRLFLSSAFIFRLGWSSTLSTARKKETSSFYCVGGGQTQKRSELVLCLLFLSLRGHFASCYFRQQQAAIYAPESISTAPNLLSHRLEHNKFFFSFLEAKRSSCQTMPFPALSFVDYQLRVAFYFWCVMHDLLSCVGIGLRMNKIKIK